MKVSYPGKALKGKDGGETLHRYIAALRHYDVSAQRVLELAARADMRALRTAAGLCSSTVPVPSAMTQSAALAVIRESVTKCAKSGKALKDFSPSARFETETAIEYMLLGDPGVAPVGLTVCDTGMPGPYRTYITGALEAIMAEKKKDQENQNAPKPKKAVAEKVELPNGESVRKNSIAGTLFTQLMSGGRTFEQILKAVVDAHSPEGEVETNIRARLISYPKRRGLVTLRDQKGRYSIALPAEGQIPGLYVEGEDGGWSQYTTKLSDEVRVEREKAKADARAAREAAKAEKAKAKAEKAEAKAAAKAEAKEAREAAREATKAEKAKAKAEKAKAEKA